jgi:hypothetical protein
MIEKLIESLWKTGGNRARGIFVFPEKGVFELIATGWFMSAHRKVQPPMRGSGYLAGGPPR